ncbi:predicted protein [Nematostella vectensis]|uniref:Cytoplasmic dynein 2 heavy chain 1 n=1 Tax=Nematostella vectensis TaxID=45351 RepID=A7SBE7_NEMVE|nr:predicted protein [Nematostella vectensis]|eukprot:XP_001631055.1 predicted protein [Nematostella vectensis]
MPSGDSRKDFVLTTAANYFGVPISDSAFAEVSDSRELNAFLDDGNSPILAARFDTHQGNKTVELFDHVEPSDSAEKVIVFFKLQPEVITPDNLHQNVFVSSMLDSPINTLYHSVQKIFAPLLLKDEKWSRNFDPKLQSLLSELEAGLGSVVRKQNTSLARAVQPGDESSLGGILTPQDEFQYWADSSVSGYDLSERERAGFFQECFQKGNVSQDFSNLDGLDLDDTLELVESTQDSLDEVWKQEDHKPYPEHRMCHLLSVIGGALARYVQRKLSALDIWQGPFQNVKEAMRKGVSVCERWVSTCETLTAQYWKRFPAHPWKGEKFVPENLSQLAARLEEVLTLRTVHEQLVRLLSSSERQQLRTAEAFHPFSGLNPLHQNPYTEPLWRAAVGQYERGMAPAEQKIAGKLRQQFRDLSAQSHQLLREFQRYKELVKRPSISKELAPERETLLGQLTVYVKSIRDDFLAKTQSSYSGDKDGGPPKGKNMPEIVNNIVWVRQLDSKVKEVLVTAESLLGDLAGFRGFRREASDLAEELSSYCTDQFESWSSEMLSAIEDPKHPLGLQTSGRLMELGHQDGKLRVHYGDRLVTLMREVRHLAALGFVVPAKIQHTSQTASKFYRHGMVLKQVAHFYNTIDQQMIPSQQSMMLDSALAFERLVKNPKQGSNDASGHRTQVTWDKPSELEAYINKLQAAAERLTSENRRLRKCHYNISDKVVNLMSIDLLRQQPRWKEALVDLREIMTSLVQHGFKAENMRTWKMHWDRQLYKALEHQYQLGLEGLNENLPEIKVELTFRQQRLQFRPPLEEIRAKYFREMRKFISIPNHFRGVGEDNSFYQLMVDHNAPGFSTVYSKAEDLFRRLVAVQEMFKDWVVLGSIDLDALVDKHLHDVADWERNFRALKARGRDAEKLPLSVKVDCITVSTVPVKSTIDDHIQQLFDALMSSLRRSITQEVQTIDTFLTSGMEALSTRPQTVEEIGEANLKHTELTSQKPQIQPLFEKAESKNKLLRNVAGGGVEQIGQLQARWDKFELMLESHELMVKEQVEVMKSNVESRVQAFQQELDKFAARWHQLKPKDIDVDTDRQACIAAVTSVKERKAEFVELEETMKKLIFECSHFGVTEPHFPVADDLRQDISTTEDMWRLFEEFNTGLEELAKEDWISFRSRTFLFDDFLTGWGENLRTKEPTVMTVRLQKDVEKYKNVVPLLKYVRGEALSQDHWLELFRLLKMPKGTTLEKLTFGSVLESADQIVTHADVLKELNSRAQGEVSIREALRELELWGAGAVFSLTSYSDSHEKELSIIKDWKELVNQVGDNQCLLQSLKDSPYYKGFEDKASIWEGRLADLDEYLHNLNQIQRKWVYLEPIFGRGALPREQGRFKRVDDDFRSIMMDVSKDNRVLSLVGRPGIRNTLVTLLDQLQRCQKSLNEFLEEKRSLFPRFYFIGDDDLLEILGQATNPTVIQSHLKKLFAGIHHVGFDEGNKTIIAIKSIEGEVVPLKRPVNITPEVEAWLGHLAVEMKDTLRELLTQCLDISRKGGGSGVDPSKFPSQILNLAEQVQFTERCEVAIKSGSLQEFLIEMESQLESYTSADVQGSGEPGDSHVLELKLKALILDTIHSIEVVQNLIKAGVKSLDEWMWQKQLRFYMHKGECMIRMCDAEFHYTYEYQGNAPKLVHTPLTDKCYLTLTQGMHMGLGGNPYGPAGTGKTESVKALGGLFGRQVLVFNCDEGIDVKSMGRIFIGLVKCGAWGCFDEFNRLEEAVLSAVSMQIQTIQAALKSKMASTELLGRQIDIDFNSGIFITLNPAGKGYGGRQKLPDNLKQLFRPVAMSRPDNELIAETIMFSEGFKEAKSLGRKLVAIFNLSKELLSKQQHYDWGLRALKTILKGCGNLLQSHKQSGEKVNPSIEARVVVQALRVNTLSKLTFADSRRFDALVQDVFPGVDVKGVEYMELAEALRAAAKECNLVVMETQVKKALELYEQLRQRMGVVVIGPSGSGKSTIWRLLRLALGKIGQTVKQYTMNPKAMPRTQLLGQIDMDTREWSDGVLTNAARQVVREPIDIQSWIICDGDIDPEWIESLNSVLDDNRLLTMPSGERIQFGPNVNFLFESHDLSCASPATISRMGMIFLSDEDTDVKALVKSWLANRPEDERRLLETWLEDYFYKALEWVLKQGDLVVETTLVGMVMNGLSHMFEVRAKQQFVCSLIRGLGANLSVTTQTAFAKEVFHWTHEMPPDPKRPLDTFYDSDRGRLASFELEVPDSLSVDDLISTTNGQPVIKTSDVKRGLDMFSPWLHTDYREPFLLVGPEGCGKEMLLRHCFEQLRSTQVAIVHCSAQSSPAHVLQKLQQMCMVISTNTGRVYRPKDCERLVLYLKDLNLPKPDKWGTSQLIAFLQQVLTYKGFYDDNLEWVGLEGVQVVASMSAGTGMGRHSITTRFTSIVRVCSIGYPDHSQLQAIYSAYLQPVLHKTLRSHPVWGSVRNIQTLAGSMVFVYDQIRAKFTVDDYSHYLFTPRDLTNWVLSLLRYDLDPGSSDSSANLLLEVWAYEARRLFRDRLVGKQGLDRFDSILASQLRSDWSVSFDRLETTYFVTWGAHTAMPANPAPGEEGKADGGAPVLSSGALPPYGRKLGKLETSDFKQVISKGLKTYARENRELDILMFKEVLDNIARVDRTLTVPGGSLLLAGRSGVGRRTAVTLVTHMHNIELVTPKVSRAYGLKQFKNDLKTVMQKAGIDGEQMAFVLEDHQLVDAAILELINSLLSAGEIPGLYSPEELEPLLSPLRDQASQEGFRGTMFSYFASRVRTNLHIVLIMDSSSPSFIVNCESNPAFFKTCAVQWMEQWSKESMIQSKCFVAQFVSASLYGASHHRWPIPRMLMPDEGVTADQAKGKKSSGDELVKSFIAIHEGCDPKDAAPRRYMTFLQNYKAIYTEKKEGLVKRQTHLQAGISKLTDAKNLVDNLKQKAGEQSRKLAEKQEEADTALQEITTSMQRASESKSEMETLKQKQGEESVKLEKRKKAIEIELSEIEPLVQEAKDAVGNIKPESLSEIRSLRMPPEVIRDILEAVLRLMGIFDTSWVSMKSFLAKRGVKDEICSFDARKITPDIRASVEELLTKNANSFDPKLAKRASVAAAPLAAWVRANVKFSVVLEKIEPLENEQAQLQRNLDKSQQRLEKLGRALDKVDHEVAEMRNRFELRTKEATQLKMELDKAQETIAAAETLVSKLDGEFNRWTGQTGFVTYLSSAPEDVRRDTMKRWCDSMALEGFELRRFLSTESEQLVWKSEGLPSDDLSMENALVIMKSAVRPFLVDPSSRATEWLKTNLKDQRLEVINQQDSNFSTGLELAVRFGKTLLIQEMDGIDPVLYPILRGDLISQGPRFVVQIGEKVIDYNEDFKLFMATRNPNPDLPPDAFAIISEVNFTTTRAGLTGQLLGITIQHEKPQLEVKKTELLRKEEELKVQLAEMEDSLLETLASAEGNILENKDLLDSLNKTKASSLTIAESLQDAHRVQTTLDQERDAYLPLAQSGSTMFFVISDLAKLNNMYRFSLSSFLRLFQRSLETNQDSSSTELRIKALKSSLQLLVHEYVCRSLFKADRLMFALHLVHGTHPELFQEKEWEFFCGLVVTDMFKRQESMKNLRESLPSWMESDRAGPAGSLKNTFTTLYKTLDLESSDTWGSFARSSQCEQEFPSQITKKICLFQQVLVVQAFRPDRLQSAMNMFASKALGMKELSPPTLNLKRLVKETVPGEPILIVISPGADPSQELQELAGEIVGIDRYHQVAMGQGQADIAMQQLHNCARNGEWLCLKNLHLVTSWLPTLEKELNSLEPHEKFRLWLTAESHPKFPTILLQSSLKVTYEAPPGIKKNMLRTYDSWSPEFVQRGNNSTRAQALFVLSWFHAIMQERRNYIPQGWTKFYEFSFGDLRAGAEIIDRLCSDSGSGSVRWQFVHGLFANAIYGGRIDNTFDMKVLESYLLQYFEQAVFAQGSCLFVQDYLEIINSLPDVDKPSFFGLPANIERSSQRIISSQVISQLKVLMRSDVVAHKFDKEKWSTELSPILNLWKKLNQGSQLIQMKVSPPSETGSDSPVTSFVLLERYSAVTLVQTVHASLAALSKVIRGTQLLSAEVQTLAASLLRQEVPQEWTSIWEGPMDPVHWLRALVSKTLALGSWVERSEARTLLKDTLDLALKTAMDNLKPAVAWKGGVPGAKYPVKLGGLQIEGCTFDGNALTENQNDSPSVSAVPTATMAWVPKDSPDPYPESECISVPIYYNSDRDSIVTCFNMPCGGNQNYWLQCGAALFLKSQ